MTELPTRKIRVTFVINDFLVGGAQRQLTRQLRYYRRELFDISVVTLFQFPGKETLYQDIPRDIHVETLNFSGFFDVKNIVRLLKVLRRLQPDIVVSSLFLSNTLCRLLRPLCGYRSIAREHNTYTYKRGWAIALDRWLARQSYKIVAVSNEVATFTAQQERIPREKFLVLQNGIDLQEVEAYRETHAATAKQEVCRSLGVPVERKLVLCVSRLTGQKNLPALIDAFAAFSQRRPEYFLVIVGEGGLRSELTDRVARLGAEDRIRLLGVVEHVGQWYLASDFLISASLIEGLSNAHLEALAFGLPIVVTQTGGTQELLRPGENGVLIEGYAADDIGRALEGISQTDLAPMRAAARASVQDFDIRRTVERYERLFADCFEAG